MDSLGAFDALNSLANAAEHEAGLAAKAPALHALMAMEAMPENTSGSQPETSQDDPITTKVRQGGTGRPCTDHAL